LPGARQKLTPKLTLVPGRNARSVGRLLLNHTTGRDLGNLAVSQPSCFLWVAWQLGTERVLQLKGLRFPTMGINYSTE
ncbi:hypothetical protein CSKR_104156, partial [Clonorchis sinensis]